MPLDEKPFHIGEYICYARPSLKEAVRYQLIKCGSDWRLESGFGRILSQRHDLEPETIALIGACLRMFNAELRTDFMDGIAAIVERYPSLGEHSIGRIISSVSKAALRVRRPRRSDFLRGTVARAAFHAPAGMDAGDFEWLVKAVAENMHRKHTALNPAFLQRDALMHADAVSYQESCPDTKGYFIKDFHDGCLITAKAPIGAKREMKTVYLKGVWSSAGNVLAYEPVANEVYAVLMCSGELFSTQFCYRFRKTDLQQMFALA